MLLSEFVYCVTITFKMTEQVEKCICMKSCIKLEHSSVETIRMIQKASASSHLMQSFLAKHQSTQVTQPSYSPDLASCDFWLFPKLKSPLKGKRFQTIDEIQESSTRQLMVIGRAV